MDACFAVHVGGPAKTDMVADADRTLLGYGLDMHRDVIAEHSYPTATRTKELVEGMTAGELMVHTSCATEFRNLTARLTKLLDAAPDQSLPGPSRINRYYKVGSMHTGHRTAPGLLELLEFFTCPTVPDATATYIQCNTQPHPHIQLVLTGIAFRCVVVWGRSHGNRN